MNETNLLEQVKQKLVAHYEKASCDRYGQLKTIDVRQICKTEEECKALAEVVKISTYGYTYGTYKGFSAWWSFKDKELEKRCQQAFSRNEGRNNCNQW
jgi:hypothetical protein